MKYNINIYKFLFFYNVINSTNKNLIDSKSNFVLINNETIKNNFLFNKDQEQNMENNVNYYIFIRFLELVYFINEKLVKFKYHTYCKS